MANEELKEHLKGMSLKELRDALDFHFAHMKLLLAEVDTRVSAVNAKVEKAEDFLKRF